MGGLICPSLVKYVTYVARPPVNTAMLRAVKKTKSQLER